MADNNNNGKSSKKSDYIKIGTFNIRRTTARNIVIIVAVFIIFSRFQAYQEKKELDARIKAEQERLASLNKVTEHETLSVAEQIQRQLRAKYGEPPEGFEWDYAGNLVALSAENLTYEDVLYTFIRSVSVLDFATAQRVSTESYTIDTYNDYYSEVKSSIIDYYSSFLRKQFRYALETVEILSVDDIAVFADGTAIATVTINGLDLQDKDFWEKDREKLFKTMRVYDETEDDSTKKNQYIYDYIYDCYMNGLVGKRQYTVDFVVAKKNGGGWLVSDDSEFSYTMSYEKGVDVAKFIFSEYEDWMREELLKEIKGSFNNKSDNSDPYYSSEWVDAEETPEPSGKQEVTSSGSDTVSENSIDTSNESINTGASLPDNNDKDYNETNKSSETPGNSNLGTANIVQPK